VPQVPPDPRRSPYTGWTRRHWESVLDASLVAARRFASPGRALIDLPGPASISGPVSDGLEGFARTFLAAGFRMSATAGAAGSVGAEVTGLAEWYAAGVTAGVDPTSPERWPRVTEIPQAKVEAASVALALHESRHLIWDALDDRVRGQVVDWLAEVIGQPYPPCNWLWFRSVVEAFLRSVGGPWSADDLAETAARTEEWYRGDGWYTDGLAGGDTGRNVDWYAGWAMHLYPLWYCRIAGPHADAGAAGVYRSRLRRYLDAACHLFAPDGPPLHQGRSLTYRYAALAPVWAGAIFDATPLAPGATRRLASGTLRHFVERGAFDADGLQPIGWYGGFDPIRQPYSGPGSPYWSSKAFAGLVLPADHPVWTDRELRLAVEVADVALALPVPGWLVSATAADGVVRVANHGTDHQSDGHPDVDDAGYARLAYSTHAGPEYDRQARQSPVDNHAALVDAAGGGSHRGPLVPLGVHGAVGGSRHRTRWPVGALPRPTGWPPEPVALRAGPWLTTASVLRGAVEVRLVRVDPAGDDGDTGPYTLRIGGYPLAGAEPPLVDEDSEATVVVTGEGGLSSAVVGLIGLCSAGVLRRTGGNAYGRHSAVPFVTCGRPVGFGRVYAAAVVLTGGTVDLADLPEVDAGQADAATTVRVCWPDGTLDLVDLDPPATR
jgi:hypothetical protein